MGEARQGVTRQLQARVQAARVKGGKRAWCVEKGQVPSGQDTAAAGCGAYAQVRGRRHQTGTESNVGGVQWEEGIGWVKRGGQISRRW